MVIVYEHALFVKVIASNHSPDPDRLGRIISSSTESCVFRRVKRLGQKVAAEVLFATWEDADLALRSFNRCTSYNMAWTVRPFKAHLVFADNWTTVNKFYPNEHSKREYPDLSEKKPEAAAATGGKRSPSPAPRLLPNKRRIMSRSSSKSRSRSPSATARSTRRAGRSVSPPTRHRLSRRGGSHRRTRRSRSASPRRARRRSRSRSSSSADSSRSRSPLQRAATASRKPRSHSPPRPAAAVAMMPSITITTSGFRALHPRTMAATSAARVQVPTRTLAAAQQTQQTQQTQQKTLKFTVPEDWGQVCLWVPLSTLTTEQQRVITQAQTDLAMSLQSDCKYLLLKWESLKGCDGETTVHKALQDCLLDVVLDYSRQMKEVVEKTAPGQITDP